MKTSFRRLSYILTLAIASGALSASAQNLRSGYFVKDYTYRFQLNPAYDNSQSFISMPGLGNVSADVHGTLAVSDVIYNVAGHTTTFMNPGVSADEFLSNIKSQNRIGADVKLTVFATGFKALGGYNTITVGARTSVGAKIPGRLFSFLKEGAANRTYDISGVGAYANLLGEVAIGHSHKVNDKMRIGASVKFLIGGGSLTARLRQATLDLNADKWTITSDAQIDANIKGLTYKTTTNKHTGHTYVNGGKINGAGINGFGAALDFGFVWQPGRDWAISVAANDVGFIRWKNNMRASTHGPKTFVSDKYSFNVDDHAPNSFKKEWKTIRNDISALYELENDGNRGANTDPLAAILNVGLEYTIPGYRPLSFGALSSTKIQSGYSWTEFRLSANLAPARCFSMGANYSVGTFGMGFGWLLNLHTTGFNLFLGMDRTFGKVSKEFVPLSGNASVNVGINFPF